MSADPNLFIEEHDVIAHRAAISSLNKDMKYLMAGLIRRTGFRLILWFPATVVIISDEETKKKSRFRT